MAIPGQFDEKDRAALVDELANIKNNWWALPDWVMAVAFVVALCSLFFFVGFVARLVGTLASIYFYCATQAAYRLGAYFGFARGFEQGHERRTARKRRAEVRAARIGTRKLTVT